MNLFRKLYKPYFNLRLSAAHRFLCVVHDLVSYTIYTFNAAYCNHAVLKPSLIIAFFWYGKNKARKEYCLRESYLLRSFSVVVHISSRPLIFLSIVFCFHSCQAPLTYCCRGLVQLRLPHFVTYRGISFKWAQICEVDRLYYALSRVSESTVVPSVDDVEVAIQYEHCRSGRKHNLLSAPSHMPIDNILLSITK